MKHRGSGLSFRVVIGSGEILERRILGLCYDPWLTALTLFREVPKGIAGPSCLLCLRTYCWLF